MDERWLRQPHAREPKSQPKFSQKLASREKEMIEEALRESGGRVSGPSGAAAKLGLPGSTLRLKIRSLKIDKNRFKSIQPLARSHLNYLFLFLILKAKLLAGDFVIFGKSKIAENS